MGIKIVNSKSISSQFYSMIPIIASKSSILIPNFFLGALLLFDDSNDTVLIVAPGEIICLVEKLHMGVSSAYLCGVFCQLVVLVSVTLEGYNISHLVTVVQLLFYKNTIPIFSMNLNKIHTIIASNPSIIPSRFYSMNLN